MDNTRERLTVLPGTGGFVTISRPAVTAEISEKLWDEALAASEIGQPVAGYGVHVPVSETLTREVEVYIERDGDELRRVIIELGRPGEWPQGGKVTRVEPPEDVATLRRRSTWVQTLPPLP